MPLFYHRLILIATKKTHNPPPLPERGKEKKPLSLLHAFGQQSGQQNISSNFRLDPRQKHSGVEYWVLKERPLRASDNELICSFQRHNTIFPPFLRGERLLLGSPGGLKNSRLPRSLALPRSGTRFRTRSGIFHCERVIMSVLACRQTGQSTSFTPLTPDFVRPSPARGEGASLFHILRKGRGSKRIIFTPSPQTT